MNKRYLVLLALLACLTGCVPVDSLNPLYTDKDTVFDESLLGTWVGRDNGAEGELGISTLVENGKQGYLLTLVDRDKEDGHCRSVMTYSAHLVNLDGRRFLDVTPEVWDARTDAYSLRIKSGKSGAAIEPRLLKLGAGIYLEFEDGTQSAGDGKVKAQMRRAHQFLKVVKDDKKLQLDWADDDAFKKAVEKGTLHLASALLGEGRDKDVVITANTRELQKFVLAHADDGTFFTDHVDELHRKP